LWQIHRVITHTSTSSMDRFLFPTEKHLQNAWTTCSNIDKPGIEILPLEDRKLQVHKVTASTSHPLVSPPSGIGSASPDVAWEAFYPKGSINPKNAIPGGFGFYLSGPPEFQTGLRTANEVLFSYSVMFDKDWDFVKGGKLPGICECSPSTSSVFRHEYDRPVVGGEGNSAYECTGGRKEDRCRCFSLRLMWRFVILASLTNPAELFVGRGDPARSTLICQNTRRTPRDFWPSHQNLTEIINSGFQLDAAPLCSREGDGSQLPKGSN